MRSKLKASKHLVLLKNIFILLLEYLGTKPFRNFTLVYETQSELNNEYFAVNDFLFVQR